jgi:molybdate transport system substrate-binding protein
MDRVRNGERADAIIMIDEPMRSLANAGVVRAETVTPIAQAGFGVAVRAGTPAPDISTPELFREALVSARAVAYSLTGASGIYFADLVEALGIAETVKARAVTIPAGFTAEKLITGEADLAVQQISELMSVDGVEIVGPFPEPLQKHTDFSVAVFSDATNPELAEEFVAHLTSLEADRAYRLGGLTSRVAVTAP